MDDFAITPNQPPIVITNEQQDKLASIADRKTAEAYFHPAWESVQEMFVEAIASATAPIDPQLPADEYKIRGLANSLYAQKLNEMLSRVKDAVAAVEKDGTV